MTLSQALALLDQLLDKGELRAIDVQLARQTLAWEQAAGNHDEQECITLLFVACATSAALGRGQVCFTLNSQADSGFHWLTQPECTDWLAACRTVGVFGVDLDVSADGSLGESSEVSISSVSGSSASDRSDAGNQDAPLLVMQGHRVYLHRYFQYEQQVLAQVRGRVLAESSLAHTSRSNNALATTLAELFELHAPADLFDTHSAPDWQAVAAATACLQPFCVITGGPGTGKTTTVTKLLSALLSESPSLRIALAAPTGKAAARMTDSIRQARERGGIANAEGIPANSFTLHRLLGWSPRGFRYHQARTLPYDCVVVDEASMIDLPMMANLLNALSPAARLILLGDRDQLASVEAGSVLADLCDAGHQHGMTPGFSEVIAGLTGQVLDEYTEAPCSPMQNAMVQLRTSHRFSADSGIGALARAVNAGDAANALAVLSSPQTDDVHVLAADESWQTRALDGYREYCERVADPDASPEAVLDAFDRFQILLALRNGPWGVEETNRQIERLLTQHGLLRDTHQPWYPGRAIMITRNDYDIGLYNGDIGILLAVKEGSDTVDRVVFRDADGGLRYLSPGRVPSHETAFAMTVHKSQGSEFAEVGLLLPPQWQPVITRELVYTAITRAKSHFWCQVSESCWQQALQHQTVRASGLRDQLWPKFNEDV
ncbi:MAG: exodeoxyribonuclease V subunit alpha [Pseudomonas sp.]|nr:exodeoxyribonuclease V subunit alpha [Pseudomonas sp.]